MPKLRRPSTIAEPIRPPKPAPLPANASPGRRWRFRRDLVIYLAHRRNGLSQRFLADVFDLPRSRIAAIIQEFRKYEATDREALAS